MSWLLSSIFRINVSNILTAHSQSYRRLVPCRHDFVYSALFDKNDVTLLYDNFGALNLPFPFPVNDIPPLIPIIMIMKSVSFSRQLAYQGRTVVLRIDDALAP